MACTTGNYFLLVTKVSYSFVDSIPNKNKSCDFIHKMTIRAKSTEIVAYLNCCTFDNNDFSIYLRRKFCNASWFQFITK